MVHKLRLKLILMITVALLFIFGIVFTTLNMTVYMDSLQQTEDILQMIADNDGFFWGPRGSWGNKVSNLDNHTGKLDLNPDDMRARRFFYVKIDSDGYILEANYNMMFDFSAAQAGGYITDALNSKKNSGKMGYFSYLIAEKPYGKIVVFAERRVEIGILARLTEITLIAAGISCVVLFLLSLVLSRWVAAPVQDAFDKQRRFSSDANHELKTPLTIISANVDILRNEIGDNIRLEQIGVQLTRMNQLIHNLLTLAKMEDPMVNLVHDRFDISKALLSTVLEFENRAFEEEKEYDYAIKPDLYYNGNEEKLKQLLTILIDNALRHSELKSRVKVTLSEENGKISLGVYNTGQGIPDGERERIFDRFYRSDDSRARETGGYGLGLAIAKSIVDAHKGRIKVSGEYGRWVEFSVIL